VAGHRFRHPATPLLGAAMLASGVLLVALGARLSFLLDDWVFILYRRGFNLDAFMRPDNEHFVAGPVAIWKLLLGAFGMGSTVPFRVVSTALFLVGVWLTFVWMRRRVGEWASLFAAVLVLFLGAAFDLQQHADHPRARGVVVRAHVTELAGLGRAAARVVLRVEVEDHPLPTQVVEAHRGAVVSLEREAGRRRAGLESSHGTSVG